MLFRSDVELVLLALSNRAETATEHVEVGTLDNRSITLGILQRDGLGACLLVAQVGDAHLVARALAVEQFLEFSHLGHLLAIHLGDYVTFLQVGSSTISVLIKIEDINTLVGSEVHFFAVLLLVVDIVVHVRTLNAEHYALYASIFLDVIYHLVHDGCRDGETIS